MAEAVLTLSQPSTPTTPQTTSQSASVWRHIPPLIRSCGAMCTGLLSALVAAQSDWCWWRWIAVEGNCGSRPAICFMLMS